MFNETKFEKTKIAIKNNDLDSIFQEINEPQHLLSVVDNESDANIFQTFRWSYDIFPSLLAFLDYCLEKKFHFDDEIISKQIIFPESLYRYYFQFHNNPNGSSDDDFISLFSIFQKHGIPLESEKAQWDDLLKQATKSWSLTVKSVHWLIDYGFDPRSLKHKGILESPHRGSSEFSFYEKINSLLETGAGEHINHFEYSHPISVLLHNVDLPFLFIYLKNGAKWDEFIFQLIKGNTKKLNKVKHFLLQFYLEHETDGINNYYEGFTPLLLAIAQEDSKAVQLLLHFGADPSLVLKKNKTVLKRKFKVGQNALSIAVLTNNMPIQKLLNGKEIHIEIHKVQNALKLDSGFHQFLLSYAKRMQAIKNNSEVIVKTETISAIEKTIPKIPPYVLTLAKEKWGELQAHHLKLLHISLLLGGKKLI
ncbi:MAG: hypothetical protein GQ574_00560 [Crocinitomix sp.]|nr:hypothetical protein [Crocinitomix sp.]